MNPIQPPSIVEAATRLLALKTASTSFYGYVKIMQPDWVIPPFHYVLITALDNLEKRTLYSDFNQKPNPLYHVSFVQHRTSQGLRQKRASQPKQSSHRPSLPRLRLLSRLTSSRHLQNHTLWPILWRGTWRHNFWKTCYRTNSR